MANDVLITPASRKIEFKDSSSNVDGKIELDGSGNLNITAPGGDLILGDTDADIFIGNGTDNIDIIFEQSGEIRGQSGTVLTIGDTNHTLKFESSVPIASNKEFKVTAQGGFHHVAPGIASTESAAHGMRTSWTAGNNRWYMYPINESSSSMFNREFTFDFDKKEWTIEGRTNFSSFSSQGNSTVAGDLTVSSTLTANTGTFTSGLTVQGNDILSEAIFANGTISGQQGLTGSSFIVYDSSKSGVFHKDVSAGANSPIGPADASIVNGQVFKMVGNLSHIEGHVTGGTTLTLDFSNSPTIQVSGQTSTSGRLDIRANSITSDEILAGAITAQSLTVLALDYVNPVTKNRNVRGWGGADEVTGSAEASAYVSYDTTEQALEIANNSGGGSRFTRVSTRSDTWQLDQNKIYRVAMDAKMVGGSANVAAYVGLSLFNAQTEGASNASAGGNTLGGNNNIAGFNGSRTAISTGVNRYFYLAEKSDLSTYQELLFYVIGANRSVDDCPQHLDPGNGVSGSNYAPYLQSTKTSGSAEYAAIRLLLWDAGTTSNVSLYFKNISVQEVGSGQIVADNIVAGTITANELAANSITASEISANAVTAETIAANSISAGMLAANSVRASEIQAASISAGLLQANTITASEIAANAVTANEIAANAVRASEIQAASISAGLLQANTITASEIAANAVTAAEIQAESITGSRLAIGDFTNLVRTPRFDGPGGTVGDWSGAGLTQVTDSVWGTAGRITANGGIRDASQPAPYVPVTPSDKYYLEIQVRTDATGMSKSSSGNVNFQFGWFEYGQNGSTITNYTNIGRSALFLTTSWQKISGVATLQSDTYFIRPWISVREGVASGNVYWSNYIIRKQSGTTLIEDGAITTDKIEVGAITAGVIAANSISAGNLAANSITASELQANSISAGNIISGTITATELAANSVRASEIQAGSISAGLIAANSIRASEIATNSISAVHLTANSVRASEIQAGSISAGLLQANTITASEIAANAVTASEVAANSITASEILVTNNSNSLTNDPHFFDVNSWVGGNSRSVSSDFGGRRGIEVIGDNANFRSSDYIPITPNTNYNLRMGAKSQSAKGRAYFLVQFVNKNKQDINNSSSATFGAGGNSNAQNWSIGSYHYWGVINEFIPQDWTEYEVSFGPDELRSIPTGSSNALAEAKFFRVGALCNRTSGGTAGDRSYFSDLVVVEKSDATRITPSSITTSLIQAGAITASRIASNSISAGNIAANAITASEIQANSISAGLIAANSIRASEIASNSISAAQIVANSITASELAANSVRASEIQANSISAGLIAANSIRASEIASNSISSEKIVAQSIKAGDIEANSISAGNIAAGAIRAQELYVTANNYVNPVSSTGNIAGWAGVTTPGGGSTNGYAAYDSTENALRLNNWSTASPTTFKGNMSLRSDSWRADPNKIYRVTMTIKGGGGGNYYIGPVLINGQVTGNDSIGGNNQGNLTIQAYNTSRAASGSPANNQYFRNGGKPASDTDFVLYLIGANRSIDDCPQHVSSGGLPYMKANVTKSAHWAIRMLNWGSSTSASTFVVMKDVSVTEVGTGQIVADNIVAGTITATEMAANSITASEIQANSISAGLIAANSIRASEIASNSISSAQIVAQSIRAGDIAANSISAGNIAANAIKASELEISSTNSASSSMFFDGTNNRIDIKDSNGVLRVRIGQL